MQRDERLGELIRSLPLPAANDEAFFECLRVSLGASPSHSASQSGRVSALESRRFRRATTRQGAWLAVACGLMAASIAFAVHVSGSSSPPASVASFARANGWAVLAQKVSTRGATVAARYRPGTLSFAGRPQSMRDIKSVPTLRPGEILMIVTLRNGNALDNALQHHAVPRFALWNTAHAQQIRTSRGIVTRYHLTGRVEHTPVSADVYIASRTPSRAQRSIARQELSRLQVSRNRP